MRNDNSLLPLNNRCFQVYEGGENAAELSDKEGGNNEQHHWLGLFIKNAFWGLKGNF